MHTPIPPTADSSANARIDSHLSAPYDALDGLAAQLATAENVLCTLVVDLNGALAFSREVVVLTPQRLLAQNPEGVWSSWAISDVPVLSLRHADHAGVGTLSLHQGDVRLAVWRFTLALNVQALRLQRLFAQAQAAKPTDDEGGLCPDCLAPLPPDGEVCTACAQASRTPPSTWVLLRLWRFARPYRFQLLSGFLGRGKITGISLRSYDGRQNFLFPKVDFDMVGGLAGPGEIPGLGQGDSQIQVTSTLAVLIAFIIGHGICFLSNYRNAE